MSTRRILEATLFASLFGTALLPSSVCIGAELTAAQPASPAAAQASDQIADPRRPPAISARGVPVVPPELFERMRQYQNARSATFRGWAPDGKGMLIRTRFGETFQLHQVYEPGGRREQLTFYDEPVSGQFIPKATDGALLVSMAHGGDENFQISLVDRTTGRDRLLTDGKSRNNRGPVTDDGSRFVYQSNRRNGKDMDLFTVDPRHGGSDALLLQVENETWIPFDWSHDGTQLLVNRVVSANETHPAILDVASKAMRALPSPDSGQVAFSQLAFAPDGQSVFVSTDGHGEFQQLARLDLKTMQYQWLTEDISWDVDEIVVDDTTGRVAFTVNENGASKLYLLDGTERRSFSLPLGIAEGLEFSPDGTQLGLTLARSDAPADAYSVDIKSGTLTRWTYSEVGGLDPKTFITASLIQFPTFDNRSIAAYYYRPASASKDKPVPVLIEIHGGPEGQSRPDFAAPDQFLINELGIALIDPNVRGSTGYGKTFLKLDNAELREDSVKDIGALLDWIAKQPELDSSRVGVTGGSYGGYMVLASLVHYGDRLRAGVDVVGISNFITFLEQTSPYRQDLRRVEYGDERDPKMRAVFERINPIAHADQIRSALLIAHGTNDPRVPVNEARQIAEKVRASGNPVWSLEADNEGHGFARKENRDYLAGVDVLFLQQNLLGKPGSP